MSTAKERVLIVDDDVDILESLEDWFIARGHEVITATKGHEALNYLRTQQINLVMLDIQLPDINGLDVLHTIEKEDIETTVIIVTAFGTVERAVEAIQTGAYDFVEKPYETSRLQVAVDKALERDRLRREITFYRSNTETDGALSSFMGMAPAIQKIRKMAERVANTDATILILGETGTGKGVLADEIHKMSDRSKKPMTGVNCSGFPKETLDSELFGHVPGAFTGATNKVRKGRFELAHGSTILLDEIGATSLDFQQKILRVLHEGVFERLGGETTIHVDVRVIAATNRDLKAAIADGSFLEDLYYRLNVVNITVPPLRDHKEDIPLLAMHFLKKYTEKQSRPDLTISDSTMQYLCAFDWPGNIRQLEYMIWGNVLLCTGDEIRPADLPAEVTGRSIAPEGHTQADTIDQLINQLIKANQDGASNNVIASLQEMAVRVALELANGNKAKAARLLGFPTEQRKRVYGLIEKYQLDLARKA